MGRFKNWRDSRRARKTDPHTSHEAVAALDPIKVTNVQFALVEILRSFGPSTDADLRTTYRGMGFPAHSDSGLRTRRKELVDAGIVEAYAVGTSQHGRPAIKWDLTADVRHGIEVGQPVLVAE